jgi:hypothetical protein
MPGAAPAAPVQVEIKGRNAFDVDCTASRR